MGSFCHSFGHGLAHGLYQGMFPQYGFYGGLGCCGVPPLMPPIPPMFTMPSIPPMINCCHGFGPLPLAMGMPFTGCHSGLGLNISFYC